MKKILFVLLTTNCSLLTVHSQSGWFLQTSGTNNELDGVHFANYNTGYAVGQYGVILKTTDSGSNWVTLTPITSQWLYDVSFIDPNTGMVVGWSGTIYKTTNGGVSWNPLNCQCAAWLTALSLIDANIAFVVGTNGAVYKTTNGGINWTVSQTGYNIFYRGVSFIDANTGMIVSTDIPSGIGRILKTTNSGVNWTLQYDNPNYRPFDIVLVNSSIAVAVGSPDLIMRSTDGGANWALQSNPGGGFFAVSFKSSDTGTAVGDRIVRTVNSGLNWSNQTSPTTQTLYDTYFLNSNTGWAVGYNGTIIKTTTGGNPVGIMTTGNQTPGNFKLYQNYPNPFNANTKFKIQISKLSYVDADVFDVLGRKIADLINEQLKPGTYEVDFNGTNYPSGIYFYALMAGEYRETRKMVLSR